MKRALAMFLGGGATALVGFNIGEYPVAFFGDVAGVMISFGSTAAIYGAFKLNGLIQQAE